MRRTILILSALALSSGAAVADRFHGGGGHTGGASHVAAAPHAVHNGGGARVYNGGSRVTDHRVYNGGGHVYNGGYNRGYVGRDYRSYRPGVRWDRSYYRNYYWDHGYYRPYVGIRYYNYYSRPALLIENYSPLAGYYWVRGSWEWNGAEWIWFPGHYVAY